MEFCTALIAKILGKIAEVEEKLDQFRKSLKVNCRDLDLNGVGFITASDVIDFLDSQMVGQGLAEVNLLVMAWDWDLDGKLDYEEFLRWAGGKVSDEVSTNELTQMLFLEIKLHQDLENDKYRLSTFSSITILDLFLQLESKSQSITLECLQNFMKSENYPITTSQGLMLIKRIVKKQANEITYFEFADFFLYNKSFFFLSESFPDPELSPLSLNYSVHKSIIDNNSEKFEFSQFNSAKKDEGQKNEDILDDSKERLKIKLSLKKDFTVKALFKWFAGKKRVVNRSRFEKGCRELGLEWNGKLFQQFDKEMDGEVNEDDFFEFFAPKSEGYRLLLMNRAKQSIDIGQETFNIIIEILKIY